MKRAGLILILALFFGTVSPVSAIDPATMTAAAPKALELASIWSPHTISAMQSGGFGLVNMGKAAFSILYLPLGVTECTLGMPFGMFDSGVYHCMKGGVAPFELVYQAVLFPIRLISLGSVR